MILKFASHWLLEDQVAPQLGVVQGYLNFRNHALHAEWEKIDRGTSMSPSLPADARHGGPLAILTAARGTGVAATPALSRRGKLQ